MSKAVLVIDIPDNCAACRLSAGDGFHLICPFVKSFVESNISKRDDECPLRDILERKPPMRFIGETPEKPRYTEYNKGWNDCLKELEGDTDE